MKVKRLCLSVIIFLMTLILSAALAAEKMQLNDLKDRLDSYVRQRAEDIIKDHICKGCLTLVKPGKGVFGTVGKEESALWCEKCWRIKTKGE